MKSLIITFLTCIFAYLLVVLCLGGFSVDSDTYGYYKNGRLNERGLISIVNRVKRMIPMKTPDTTVVGINYNYVDDTVPHGQINYYHVVDNDKLEYYKNNSQTVVNHMATTQCSNADIVDMLTKLDKITISFYDADKFLYGLEISSDTCEEDSKKVQHNEPEKTKESSDDSKVEDDKPKQNNEEKDSTVKVSSNNLSVKKHVLAMNKVLPFKTSFGELQAVEAEGENSIIHSFNVNNENIDRFKKNVKSYLEKMVQSYCKNTELSGLMDKIDHITLNFEYQHEQFESVQVSKETCRL